jgi:hypothetical protein
MSGGMINESTLGAKECKRAANRAQRQDMFSSSDGARHSKAGGSPGTEQSAPGDPCPFRPITCAREQDEGVCRTGSANEDQAMQRKFAKLGCLIACVVLTAPALADDATELKTEIEREKARITEEIQRLQERDAELKRLQKRLDQLESAGTVGGQSEPVTPTDAPVAPLEAPKDGIRDTHQLLTGTDLAAADFPGSWPMFGTDYRMKIGGYVRVDALVDFGGTGDKYQFLVSEITVPGTAAPQRDPYFNLFVKETRFNIDVRKSAPGEPAQQAFIEMDFFDENSAAPRLRHAYFVYGNLVLGQTWSTLVDLRALPETIDFAYGNVLFSGRPVQIRWQQEVSDQWSWAAAIEMPSTLGIDNPTGQPGSESVGLPALTGRVAYEGPSRFVMLGGALGQLRWDGEGTGPNATATQWAVVVAGRQYLGKDDYLAWSLSYGDGSAANITALAGSNANATLTAAGRLETNLAASAALGYAHKFSPTLTANLAYAWTGIEMTDQLAADSIRRGQVAHVNLIWSATRTISTGIEYVWGRRENASGETGDASRIQFMAKHSF